MNNGNSKKRYMKPVRIILAILGGLVSTAHADIASVQYVQSIITSITPPQADWGQTDSSADDYIQNKPSIPSTAADVGAVPTSRTVNTKALTTDITLDGRDIAVTGYSKPNATSAIAASDTINAAIGKLEAGLDGKQATIPANTYDAYGAAAAVDAKLGSGFFADDGEGGSWTVADALTDVPSAGDIDQIWMAIDGYNSTFDENNTVADAIDAKQDKLVAAAGATQNITGAGSVTVTQDANGKITITGAETDVSSKQDKLGGSGNDGKAVIASSTAGTVSYRAIDTTSGGTASSTDLITSGAVNAGLAGKVSTSTTVNGNALSSNVTLDGADIALTGYTKPNSTSAVAAADTVNAAIGKLEAGLDGKQATIPANTYDAYGDAAAVDAKLGGNFSSNSTVADAIAAKQNELGGSGNDGKAVIASSTAGTVSYRAIDATSGGTSSSTDLITSGAVNSGLAGKVSTSTTVNGHQLSGNVTVTKSDVGLGNVADVDTTNAANISSGTMNVARLPVGTTSTTVAAGDDARFDSVSTTQPSGTPPTGRVWVWFN